MFELLSMSFLSLVRLLAITVEGDGGGDDGEDVRDGEHVGTDCEVKAEPEGLIANHELSDVLFFFSEKGGAEDEGAENRDNVEQAGEVQNAESDVNDDVDSNDIYGYWFVFALEKVVDKHF